MVAVACLFLPLCTLMGPNSCCCSCWGGCGGGDGEGGGLDEWGGGIDELPFEEPGPGHGWLIIVSSNVVCQVKETRDKTQHYTQHKKIVPSQSTWLNTGHSHTADKLHSFDLAYNYELACSSWHISSISSSLTSLFSHIAFKMLSAVWLGWSKLLTVSLSCT